MSAPDRRRAVHWRHAPRPWAAGGSPVGTAAAAGAAMPAAVAATPAAVAAAAAACPASSCAPPSVAHCAVLASIERSVSCTLGAGVIGAAGFPSRHKAVHAPALAAAGDVVPHPASGRPNRLQLRAYGRALRLRGGRPRCDRGTRRGRFQRRGGRSRASRPRAADGFESGRKRGRIGARDLRVRGCARKAGGAAGRRRRHRAGRRDRRGRCRHAALGRGRFQPARRRNRFHVRARRRAAARLRPRLRVGFHSVGREYRPFWRGAIELTVCAVVGWTMSSSRCNAARQVGDARASSSLTSRASLTPNDVSTHAANCRQPMPVSQQPGEEQHDHRDRRADRAEHVGEACRETRGRAFVSVARQRVSVQLATNTAAKPSHRRIEPRPASPTPPGSIACTRRQKRRRNQTAEMPNQPKTTVCML